MDADNRLRMLYRLAESAEGDALERVRSAIAMRRQELELGQRGPSAWDGLPVEEERTPWTPGADPFRPAAADALPVTERRAGERGYRIVGTAKRRPVR